MAYRINAVAISHKSVFALIIAYCMSTLFIGEQRLHRTSERVRVPCQTARDPAPGNLAPQRARRKAAHRVAQLQEGGTRAVVPNV